VTSVVGHARGSFGDRVNGSRAACNPRGCPWNRTLGNANFDAGFMIGLQ